MRLRAVEGFEFLDVEELGAGACGVVRRQAVGNLLVGET
jgi:hypothetical protein